MPCNSARRSYSEYRCLLMPAIVLLDISAAPTMLLISLLSIKGIFNDDYHSHEGKTSPVQSLDVDAELVVTNQQNPGTNRLKL